MHLIIISEFHCNPRTLRIKESGVQQKLWEDVNKNKPKCSQQGSFSPLALMDVSPVVFAFLGGFGLSFCVFLVELVVNKYGMKNH